MKANRRAGQLASLADLVDVPKLITAYYENRPDRNVPEQRVAFGTSGHRGSSLDRSFNEWHILAIAQAICLYRQQHRIVVPLFLGIDTHALSRPALASALEVLAANSVDVMLADKDAYTPAPVISHAILTYNHGRETCLGDGIVITPSHNPPETGGFKYNPSHGGPAEEEITSWIESQANKFLESNLDGVKRIPFEKASSSPTTYKHDYLTAYVEDLQNVIDTQAIRNSGITFGVDPLGGAGVHYWEPIAARYGLKLKVVNDVVDPTFRFMTLDWDGRIRMDPSSQYAGGPVVGLLRNLPYEEQTIALAAGDVLIAYTDGIREAMRIDDEEWGEERMIAAALAARDRSARQIVGDMFRAVDEFTGGAPQHDDLTLVVFKVDK